MISIRRWWSAALVVDFDSFSSLPTCSCQLYNNADIMWCYSIFWPTWPARWPKSTSHVLCLPLLESKHRLAHLDEIQLVVLIFPKESKDAGIVPLWQYWFVCSVLPWDGLEAQEQEGLPYSKQSAFTKLLPTNPSELKPTMGAFSKFPY